MSFESEFNSRWNLFLNNNAKDIGPMIDVILRFFHNTSQVEPHESIKLLPDKDNPEDNLLISFQWPDQLFYYMNEELANLNRSFVKSNKATETTEANRSDFERIYNLLRVCLELSKNVKCLNLVINTSLINQFLTTSSQILNQFSDNELIGSYFKHICFLLIRAHDPSLGWFKSYYCIDTRYQSIGPTTGRQFVFKFDPNFFPFLFDGLSIFKKSPSLSVLGLHTYACILNEFNDETPQSNGFNANLNDNLLRAIKPQVVDLLLDLFKQPSVSSDDLKIILVDQETVIYNGERLCIRDDRFQMVANLDQINKLIFADLRLVVCHCLPLIINILHLALPDKRLIDIGNCLDRFTDCLSSDSIQSKYELIKCYLRILDGCGDKAAMKIVLVSNRFIVSLLEQFRSAVDSSEDRVVVGEFVYVVLLLIKNLLTDSDSVKDIFNECNGYDILFAVLMNPKLEIGLDISVLLNEMISEKSTIDKKQVLSGSLIKCTAYQEEIKNCSMIILLIKLAPRIQPIQAQQYTLTRICQLCTLNMKNLITASQHSILLDLIHLLNFHKDLKSFASVINIAFRTIQSLGLYSINNQELKAMFELLQPRRQFPYGLHVLRCLLSWSKNTSSVGFNFNQLGDSHLGESSSPSTQSAAGGSMTTSGEQFLSVEHVRLRRTSNISLNHFVTSNMAKGGAGALTTNAQQQSKHFFDFHHANSGIRVPPVKRWPGYAFTFHAWIKLRSDLELFEKKRRQLYSFYNDQGQGFEAFFTADCSSLVVSVCTKKEFLSVQLRELNFDSSSSLALSQNAHAERDGESPEPSSTSTINSTSTRDFWHSITIMHVAAKSPFGSSQVLIYVDGILKKETELKMPYLNDTFNHVRIGAACARPTQGASNSYLSMSNTITAPLSNLKSVFNFRGSPSEKSLNVTSIPSNSQDTVWDVSTCLMGQMSSCFVLHDTITDIQARLLHELGPNNFYINWLDIVELNDLKSKFLFNYDAKCCKDLTCFDLSSNKLNGKFSGEIMSCSNFKESLNAIGSIQAFYPMLNYLATNPEYSDLISNEWFVNAKFNLNDKLSLAQQQQQLAAALRKSSFDDSELEQNIVSMVLNLVRYLFHNNDIIQDRMQRSDGVCLLGYLLQRLPKRYIDINLLRICQELVAEATTYIQNRGMATSQAQGQQQPQSIQQSTLDAYKTLAQSIYEHIIFEFRIWNKADYEIRIGHIQYISTIVKDDKKYFRRKYGIQFFLDILKTYFGGNEWTSGVESIAATNALSEEDLRNLRNSFFGLIKYYAQKEIKIGELNAICSFLSATRHLPQLQSDLCDVLIALLEAPSPSDQLFLLFYEPQLADGIYALLVQVDLDKSVQKKLTRIIRSLLKSKKVYDKSKSRLKLDDCGTYGGLVSKMSSEYMTYLSANGPHPSILNEYLAIELLENLLLEENNIQMNPDNVWHLMSLLNLTFQSRFILELEQLMRARLAMCELLINCLFSYPGLIKHLARSPAWQDILCQYLCVDKQASENSIQNGNPMNSPPPINIISPSSTVNLSNSDASIVLSPGTDENWENETDDGKNDDLVATTSTPSNRLVKKNRRRLLQHTDSADSVDNNSSGFIEQQTDFNKKLNKQLTSTATKTVNFKHVQGLSNERHMAELEDDNEEKEIGVRLTEKVLYIVYRLMWDGIVGSSEDLWKERCQVFSSLHRLGKEFNLITPIDVIELRILEMSVQRCCTEVKKSASSKDHQSDMENSRELMKLIDNFVSNFPNKATERLVSNTISLLDQIRAFDQKITPNTPSSVANSPSVLNDSAASTTTGHPKLSKATSFSFSMDSSTSSSVVLNTSGIVHDEWAETSYLGMNILMNILSSPNTEVCAQASAKINTILHSRHVISMEEACYLIASVEHVISETVSNNDDQHYAFLIPIMKSLIEKSHSILQLSVQVPNMPSFSLNTSLNFYEDFKQYCQSPEWRSFVQKHVQPFKEQYLAMTIIPCQMNMKLWWNTCHEALMVAVHRRNRSMGECKIKFEDQIYSGWKEREKTELTRYQNYLLHIKKSNLNMRKSLHTMLRFFNSDFGAWSENPKDIYWMLSSHENRERMRCKLVENLKFDSHFEASRLRDYSGYSNSNPNSQQNIAATVNNDQSSATVGSASTLKLTDQPESGSDNNQELAQKLLLNKEAINKQINEDSIGDEEFQAVQQSIQEQQQHQNNSSANSTSNQGSAGSGSMLSIPFVQADSGMASSVSDLSRRSSITSSTTVTSFTGSGNTVTSQVPVKTAKEHPPVVNITPEQIEGFAQLEEKEKLIIRCDCELITVTKVVKGRFELTNKCIYFIDTSSSFYTNTSFENDLLFINDSNENPTGGGHSNNLLSVTTNNNNQNQSNSMQYQVDCSDFDALNDFKIPLSQLREVQLRRFNLRRSALEFFLINEMNFFINFNKQIRNKIYGKIVSMKLPNMPPYAAQVRTPADLLKLSDYTQKWCNHEMSNFEYLMKLNTIAGRTYNDLSQYHVFPWILRDYVSEQLDLNNPEVYRDLSKPVGILNKKFEDYVRQKYDLFEDPTGTMKAFHYGTHYSNAANVMHFLIRLEPFTTLHIQLQSDRFDVADRQFHSLPSSWRILYENPNDVKELIPEFFYLPEFLENMNNFDFGELQLTKNKVNNVTLPPWAKSPEHFIYVHRKALESEYVSQHLHEWIDLIFGYKQQGHEAEKAANVFMYCSYEGAIDLDAITDPTERRATEGMISNFGQTPSQLLKEPHVKRKTREQSIRDRIAQGKPIILWHQINNLKAFYVEFCDPKKELDIDPIMFISIPRNHVRSFMQGLGDPLITVCQSGVLGVNGWQAHERSSAGNLFSFEKDPSLLSDKSKKSIAGPFDPNLDADHRLFLLTHDSKLLITGGHWDNSLRVFSLTKYRNVAHIYQHSNVVTCLAIDYTGSFVVSGSRDCSSMVWQVILEYGVSVNLDPVPMHILYGHSSSITSVDISNELDLVLSASLDGTINMYSLRSGGYIRTLTPASRAYDQIRNISIKLGNLRHILVYVQAVVRQDDIKSGVNVQLKKTANDIFLYSINGKLVSTESVGHQVQDMIIKDDYCILAVLVNQRQQSNVMNASLNSTRSSISDLDSSPASLSSFSSKPSVVTGSKIIFKEIFEFKTLQIMRLKAPITCMFMTREDSHLLVGLRDGKLIVITGDRQLK